jgi:hypothetical protein
MEKMQFQAIYNNNPPLSHMELGNIGVTRKLIEYGLHSPKIKVKNFFSSSP